MPTIIARKITGATFSANDDHAKALIAYCARPETEDGREKCILLQTYGFSDDSGGRMTTAEIGEELAHTASLTSHRKGELISHWIVSWKGGKPPAAKDVLSAAKYLLHDLGYGRDHKYAVAIHADADHVHAHVVACRVNALTGRVLDEGNGWYKKEAQKSLARIAHTHGWTLEPGARYRIAKDAPTEDYTTPDGKAAKRLRVVEIKTSEPPAMRPRPLKAKEERAETRGVWSEQRYLQGALSRFFEQHAAQEMQGWKAADLHRELARIGVSLERITSQKGRHSLVFSCGQNKYKAGELLTGLTYRGLMGRIKGDWRPARDNIAPILAEAREKIAAERAAWEQDKARELAQREAKRSERRAARPKAQGTPTQTPHKAASRPRPYQRPPKGNQADGRNDPATALLNSIFGAPKPAPMPAPAPKPAPEPKPAPMPEPAKKPEPEPRMEREQPPAQAAQEVKENGRHQLDQSLVDGRGRGGTAAEVEAIRQSSSDDQRDGRLASGPGADQGARAAGDIGRQNSEGDQRRKRYKAAGISRANIKRDPDADRETIPRGNGGDQAQNGDRDRQLDPKPLDHAAHGSDGGHTRGLHHGDAGTAQRADAPGTGTPGKCGRSETEPRLDRNPGKAGSPGEQGERAGTARRDRITRAALGPEEAALLRDFGELRHSLEQAEIQQDIDTQPGPAPGYAVLRRPRPKHGPRGPRQ